MHGALRSVAALSALLFCASQPLSPTEMRLIGKWRVTGKSASIDLTLRGDHYAHMLMRWSLDGKSQTRVFTGSWRARSDRFYIDWRQSPEVVRQRSKEPKKIIKFTSDVLILDDQKHQDPLTARRLK
jgi:hypothetical protein